MLLGLAWIFLLPLVVASVAPLVGTYVNVVGPEVLVVAVTIVAGVAAIAIEETKGVVVVEAISAGTVGVAGAFLEAVTPILSWNTKNKQKKMKLFYQIQTPLYSSPPVNSKIHNCDLVTPLNNSPDTISTLTKMKLN